MIGMLVMVIVLLVIAAAIRPDDSIRRGPWDGI
jgi:hypothetical protein